MLITVNGSETEVPDGAALHTLLPDDRRGTAVAIDGVVVPRHNLAEHVLSPGDRVEIVTAVQGG